MSFMGEINDIGVADLLYLLALRQQSGRLSVVANGDHLDITRKDGTVAETTTSANYVTANIAELRKNGIRIEVTALEDSELVLVDAR